MMSVYNDMNMYTSLLISTPPLHLSQTMETLQEDSELIFLYQLIPGHTDSSYACHVASMVGLPQEVVQRGAKVTGQLVLVHLAVR